MPTRPTVGITTDLTMSGDRLKADVSLAYAQRVADAGGVAVLLPPILELVEDHVRLCDGVILTGGDDPAMEPFGLPTHPAATRMHPQRQAYELALLRALERRPELPTLGICLGMQLMCLNAGGRLNQHLPDTLATAQAHRRALHVVRAEPGAPAWVRRCGDVWSNHHQAVDDAGRLAVIARSADGVIEAVHDPQRPHYIGLQWHPERTEDQAGGQAIFDAMVSACARRA